MAKTRTWETKVVLLYLWSTCLSGKVQPSKVRTVEMEVGKCGSIGLFKFLEFSLLEVEE